MGMAAPSFRHTRGDTLTWTFSIPEDITGWAPKWSLKAQSDWPNTLDSAAIVVVTTVNGLVSTPGATSTVTLTVAASTTAAWLVGMYVWDLQLVSGVNVRTVEWDTEGHAYGWLSIEPDVTRLTT